MDPVRVMKEKAVVFGDFVRVVCIAEMKAPAPAP